MTPERVAQWIDGYLEAWKSYDPAAIEALFTQDARYAYNPWDEPLRGSAAIVESWRSEQDEPGTWEADYSVASVQEDSAIIVGETRYVTGSGTKTYSNLFQVTFDTDGRCSSFVEWYMAHPKSK
jgi:hypothetical protein